jgi:hypothetical protein
MLRKFVFALLAFGVVTVGLLADEISGKVKSVDPDKNTITITTKDAGDKEFTVDKDTKFVKGSKDGTKDLPEGLKDKAFTGDKLPRVTITYEKKGDKEVVSEVKITAGKKKKADK